MMELYHMPLDIVRNICIFLSIREIIWLCQCNKRLYQVLNERSFLWKLVWLRDISEFVIPKDENYKKAYIEATKKIDDRNKYYAQNGFEKLLKGPFSSDCSDVIMCMPDPDGLLSKDAIMCVAAQHGHKHLVQMMLKLGVENKSNAMSWAALGGQREIIEMMLKLGAYNYNGCMLCAARAGYLDIVEWLLELGADDYNVAMEQAARGGHAHIVDKMLSLGADDYRRGWLGAKFSGRHDLVNKFERLMNW